MSSWRHGTKLNYNTYLTRWIRFCDRKHIDFLKPTDIQVLTFFSHLSKMGYTYRQMCAMRSALSALLSNHLMGQTWGQLPLIKRYMKGLFELAPVLPKVYYVWDVREVLSYLRSCPSPHEQSFKMLSQNLAFLLGLLSGGQRCQTIHQIEIPDISIAGGLLCIPVMGKIKQTRPGKHMGPLQFRPYREPNLCLISLLTHYLKVSATYRTTPKLFISYTKPHSAVGRETIARWCKSVLGYAGIDVNLFSSHSSRAAATSKAKSVGVSLTKILECAGWSNAQTFAGHYDKVVCPSDTFQDLLLK